MFYFENFPGLYGVLVSHFLSSLICSVQLFAAFVTNRIGVNFTAEPFQKLASAHLVESQSSSRQWHSFARWRTEASASFQRRTLLSTLEKISFSGKIYARLKAWDWSFSAESRNWFCHILSTSQRNCVKPLLDIKTCSTAKQVVKTRRCPIHCVEGGLGCFLRKALIV